MTSLVLETTGLRKSYPGPIRSLGQWLTGGAPSLYAVDGVMLRLAPASTLALVGESGSGKTTTGRLVTLQERPTDGRITFQGRDITRLVGAELKAYRRQAQMIFQNPFEALDPRLSVGKSVAEPLELHGVGHAADRRDRVVEMLEAVDLRPVASFIDRFPAELSGGQLQRIAIARALILSPSLVVADEPVSMLDVSVRAGTMALMLELQQRLGTAFIYITHDLAVARLMANRIAVMFMGHIVEEGPAETVIRQPGHPYTRLLVSAVARHRPGVARRRIRTQPEQRLPTSHGCRFAQNCPDRADRCTVEAPQPVHLTADHWSRCHFALEGP